MNILGVEFIPASAVCEQFGISRKTLWLWEKEGRFPKRANLAGKKVYFRADDIKKHVSPDNSTTTTR